MKLLIKFDGVYGQFSVQCEADAPACVYDTPKYIGSFITEALKGYEKMLTLEKTQEVAE